MKKYILAADFMEKLGGAFVAALAAAYYKADPVNTKKLENAFKNYFEQYQRIGLDALSEQELLSQYCISKKNLQKE